MAWPQNEISRGVSVATCRQARKSWLHSILMEIAVKPSVKSRGKTNPRGIKRKMSNFNLRRRGQLLHQRAPTVVKVIRC